MFITVPHKKVLYNTFLLWQDRTMQTKQATANPIPSTVDRYQQLMDAARIISRARLEVSKEDGPTTSPAWEMAYRAERYLIEQAKCEIREGR